MLRKAKNTYHRLKSAFAASYFGFPSRKLKVIGVTGTDGKTTTATMLYKILTDFGSKVSIITSVSAQIGNQSFDTGFHVTTPSPWQVQKLLEKAASEKSEYFILETTSHRLDQNVVANIDFSLGIMTNITQEHLDYHKTWDNYVKAKAKLFQKSKVSILNKNDNSYQLLKRAAKDKVITYSATSKADVNKENFKLHLKVVGTYNMYNALAAAAAAQALGVGKRQIIQSLNTYKGTKGRMEEIILGQDYKYFVDFAHTPNSLKEALTTLKSLKNNSKSKLIAVFGSAGGRDKQKRPLMGGVACEIADISIITAEDPRTEKVVDIIDQIAASYKGKKKGRDYFKQPDRQKAIEDAISMAAKGDIVASFGKAHEKSMCWGKTEHPWDEFKVVKNAIRKEMNK